WTCWTTAATASHAPLLTVPTRRSSDLLLRGGRVRRVGGCAAADRVRVGSDRPTPRCGGRKPARRGRASAAARWRGAVRRLLAIRSEEHTSELQSRENLVCRLLLEKKKQ